MDNKARQKIIEIKEIKARQKITYPDIMEKMDELNPAIVPSLSTLRRVFRDGSESRASSFNYEEILIPIYEAVKALEKAPPEKTTFERELEGYKAVIEVQNEELDRLFEIKELLDGRVEFLVSEIKTKDKAIDFLMRQIDSKDEMIKRLMEKCV